MLKAFSWRSDAVNVFGCFSHSLTILGDNFTEEFLDSEMPICAVTTDFKMK